jgi:hypothetical protein
MSELTYVLILDDIPEFVGFNIMLISLKHGLTRLCLGATCPDSILRKTIASPSTDRYVSFSKNKTNSSGFIINTLDFT